MNPESYTEVFVMPQPHGIIDTKLLQVSLSLRNILQWYVPVLVESRLES